jgi:hypothetical protein
MPADRLLLSEIFCELIFSSHARVDDLFVGAEMSAASNAPFAFFPLNSPLDK